jgi:transposase
LAALGLPSGEIAERVGVSRRTVFRWLKLGVPLREADRAAVALFGLPDWVVWPEVHDLTEAIYEQRRERKRIANRYHYLRRKCEAAS